MRFLALLGGLSVLSAGVALADSDLPPEDPHQPIIQTPSLNFYGLPGMMDMPSADMLPEGQFATNVAHFAGQTRITLAFQPTDWLLATFRYNAIPGLRNVATLYDRSFDLRVRLLKERRYLPTLSLGLQDIAGTGIYSGEYLVATKSFDTQALGASRIKGRLKLSAGLGWGRLGSYGSLGSTGTRPVEYFGLGGQPGYDKWFRGPFAAFGGIEWQANDRLGFKLEYSSDGYVQETQDSGITRVFDRKSQVNFGMEYQATPRTRLGAYYLYGSEFGLTAQIQLNPYKPLAPTVNPAPYPVEPRPSRSANPQAWSTGWSADAAVVPQVRDAIAPVLRSEGLQLEAFDIGAETAELRFRNLRYRSNALALGRASRVLAATLPASVEVFHLVLMSQGMPLSRVTVHRSDLETLEFENYSADMMLVETRFSDAAPMSDRAVPAAGLYPAFSWSVTPYFTPAYFDPAQPVRMDAGVALNATYKPAPGWVISGAVRQRFFGNLDEAPLSESLLPRVRTDQVLYAQHGTTLNKLYAARYWRPGKDLFARASVGYFEYGFGGLSTELLWKPVNSRLALGVEANYSIKRDYDQKLGFQDYKIANGHASAYYDFDNGFSAQLDVGRYLAGDIGATFRVDRVFNNGWSVGGFFTKTDASTEEFGEGSFDKGIRFSIPVTWFLGTESQKSVGTLIRPIQRDGGVRMDVPGRLYGQVRNAHRKALSDQWPRFWE